MRVGDSGCEANHCGVAIFTRGFFQVEGGCIGVWVGVRTVLLRW
jgi:hypothetical protein